MALDFFNARETLAVETKASPQDVVSRADREVEAFIRARVSADFPGDGFLGEEGGAQGGSSGFTWVIDPIDGTTPFLSGLPHWCVAISVLEGSVTRAAATYVPCADEMFTALAGGGAALNGVPLRIAADKPITGGMTAIGASHRTSPAHVAGVISGLMARGGIFYRNGSGANMIASVAAGRLVGYYEPHMHPWDCLGGLLMVSEAGGMTLPFGSPDDMDAGGRVLVGAPGAWADLLAIVGP